MRDIHWYDLETDPRYTMFNEAIRAKEQAIEDRQELEMDLESATDDLQSVYRSLQAVAEVSDLPHTITGTVEYEIEVNLTDLAREFDVQHEFHEAHDVAGKY